jgi:hypothetical protein
MKIVENFCSITIKWGKFWGIFIERTKKGGQKFKFT